MGWVTNGPGAATLPPGDRAGAVAAAKALLRVATADEDALIATLADGAYALAERFTGQALIARAMTVRLAPGAGWRGLPVEPVRAITGVSRVTPEGIVALNVGDYRVDIDAAARGWVSAHGAVEVRLTGGMADDWAGLPAPVRQGVAMLAAHLFERRDGGVAVPPAAIGALWRPYRRLVLDAERRA